MKWQHKLTAADRKLGGERSGRVRRNRQYMRDYCITKQVLAGGTYRAVGKANGISHAQVQRIVHRFGKTADIVDVVNTTADHGCTAADATADTTADHGGAAADTTAVTDG